MVESKEISSNSRESSKDVINWTKKSLSLLEKETRINFFKKARDRIKNLFGNEWNETQKCWSDKISDEMFQQLLIMEGKQEKSNNTLVAKIGTQFWEKFATWPYGMVYKHIDENGNLLKKPVEFKVGEEVSADWALKNAKAYYDKEAKERKEDLEKKWYTYTQNELDALVSTCGGTKKSKDNCKSFVLANRNDKNNVAGYIRTHATTAAGNGKVMPGLVRRREFEADWFQGSKKLYADYKVKHNKTNMA